MIIKDIKDVSVKEEQPSTQSHEVKTKIPITSTYKETKARDTFFNSLSFVGHEHRYGKMLNHDKDVQLLIQLFTDIHMNDHFIDTLYALKTWDHFAFVHSFDVFVLGTLIAKRLGLHQLESIALGFLFHDIGKMEISQDILAKEGKLTFNEFERIKRHTIEGEAILNSLGQSQIAHFARSHHERMDGSGYPDKLSKKELSKELRILQIIDVYSALTLQRPYKDEIPAQEALQILARDVNKYDKSILLELIEALAIYPSHSTV